MKNLRGTWGVTWAEKVSSSSLVKVFKTAYFKTDVERDNFVDNVLRKLPLFLYTTAKIFKPEADK